MHRRNVSPWIQDIRSPALKDARRLRRFQQIVAAAAESLGETIAATFKRPADRQAAYDFVEHETIEPERVLDVVSDATASAVAKHDEVLLLLDGSSLSLVDEDRSKGFGSVGSKSLGARGLKVLTSLVCDVEGTPFGCGRLQFWVRGDEPVRKRQYRPLQSRESFQWHQAVDATAKSFAKFASNTKIHVVADREADASEFLKKLSDEGYEFTIRGGQRGRVMYVDGRRLNLLRKVKTSPSLGTYAVEVRGSATQRKRTAHMEVRTAKVELVLRDRHRHERTSRAVTVVWARETSGGKQRLDWVLLTSKNVRTPHDAAKVIGTYTCRWRIEDFHRAWKKGGCDVEKNQLRSAGAVIKWASVMAVVAARAEHLKHRSRTEPKAPASSEFSDDELAALRLAKSAQKKRTEKLHEGELTLDLAVRWLADIGGFVGNRGSGPPGSTVIARGLERLEIFGLALKVAREESRRGEKR
jgi:hypothetical protein